MDSQRRKPCRQHHPISSTIISWNEAGKKWNARTNMSKEQLGTALQRRYAWRFAK